jgi:hypothetical protein
VRRTIAGCYASSQGKGVEYRVKYGVKRGSIIDSKNWFPSRNQSMPISQARMPPYILPSVPLGVRKH